MEGFFNNQSRTTVLLLEPTDLTMGSTLSIVPLSKGK